MAIDPSIPLSGRPVEMPSILDSYQQVLQLQALKSAGEERRASAQEAQAKRQREAEIEAAFQEAITFDPVTQQPSVDYGKLLGRKVPAAALFEVKKIIDATGEQAARAQKSTLDVETQKANYLAGIARATQASGYDADAFRFGLVGAKKVGALSQEQLDHLLDAAERDPSAIQQWATRAIAQAGGREATLERITTVDDQGREVTQFVAPTPGSSYPTAPPKAPTAPNIGSFEDYVVRRYGPTPTPEQITQARKDYQQADDRPITINAAGQRPITQTAEAGLITRLNTQWSKATAPKRELEAQLTTMRAGMTAADRGDIPQATEAVLQPFLKILDPNSVVREGEFWRLREGLSLLTRAQTAFQRLTKGGFVPVAELKKYAQLAEEIASRYDSYVRGERARIGRVAERYSIPQELVFEGPPPPEGEATVVPSAGGPAPGLSYQDYLKARGQK